MFKKSIIFSAAALTLALASCDENVAEPQADPSINVNISGLEDLGNDFRYEGWLIVNGAPVSTGLFTVNGEGQMSQTNFAVKNIDVNSASKFVLTIEPFPDADPAPSKTKLLAGDFNSNSASIGVDAPEALGSNFEESTGKYVLATPSDGADNNEKSGVWFLGSLPPTAGLSLPTLPEGWIYEGWAVINGTPVSTGTFSEVSGADQFAGFSGDAGTPPYPGEDFIKNAPNGLTFPTDLSGAKVVISVEPFPDNSAAPFTLKPLLADVPTDVADHQVYDMGNIARNTNPTGTVSR